MDEIIYELRDHSSGLNCGRWDYIFSVIKKFRQNSNFVLPDRSAVTMTVPFMDAYVKLLIQTCHRRQVHAMGGMAAQIPIKDDKAANDKAMEGVYADKLREVKAGHDGTWVAHPALAAPTPLPWRDSRSPEGRHLWPRVPRCRREDGQERYQAPEGSARSCLLPDRVRHLPLLQGEALVDVRQDKRLFPLPDHVGRP